ncbi:hypothetical protein ACOMHN_029007 [Nucella lapillus]
MTKKKWGQLFWPARLTGPHGLAYRNMVSRAALLSGLILLLAGFFPLRKGNRPVEDTTSDTIHISQLLEEESSEASIANSLISSTPEDLWQTDQPSQALLYRINLSPKRVYRRKADINKQPVASSHKTTGNSKASVQYDPLMKMVFGRKFKVKTSGRHKDGHHGESPGSSGDAHGIRRMEKMLGILAIFGDHFHTDHGAANAAAESASEAITVTTQTPAVGPKDMSCVHVEGYDQHRWIRIVNLCARDWSNQTVHYLCRDALVTNYVMTDTPVQDIQGTVYANRYCAFCNHVPISNIRKWQIAWTCEKNNNPAASLMRPRIFGDLMDIVTSLRLGNRCKMIRTPAIPQSILSCSAPVLRGSQSMPLINAGNHIPQGTGYPVSLNILMNFDFSGKTHIMYEDVYAKEILQTKMCPKSYVWDGEMGRCREMVCANGYHFDESYTTCLKDDNYAATKEEEVLTDLSQLARSNDIERVTLEVEVPAGFTAFVSISDKEFWKEQIAEQLNITTKRIHQFNITLGNATGGASTLLIQKLTKSDFRAASQDDDVSGTEVHHRTTLTDDLAEGMEKEVNEVDSHKTDSREMFTSIESLQPSPSTGNSKLTKTRVEARKNNVDRRFEFKDHSVVEPTKATEDDLKEDLVEDGTDSARSRHLDVKNNKAIKSKRVASSDVNNTADLFVKNIETTESEKVASSDVKNLAGMPVKNNEITKYETVPPSDENPPAIVAAQNNEITKSEAAEAASDDNAPASSSEEEGEKGPNEFKIIMSFILLPPESFQSSEQRSGYVVEALSSLVSSKEFKFIINGTSLQVESITQEDKVGVLSPACPYGLLLVLDGEQIELFTAGGSNFTTLKDLRTGKYYIQGMFDVSLIVTQPIGNTTQKPQSFVYNALACEMPQITDNHCSRIKISSDEYTIHPITKTLTFQNTTLNVSSYEYINDKYDEVEICLPESYKKSMAMQPSRLRYYYFSKNCVTDYQDWLKAEGYLTAILGRISIVALFVVLLTYFLFPTLRNLPGVNTMQLTFALFLAEVIFASGEEVQIPWLCMAVAATLHYCFLSSHCWMNVMSYDVYRTFAGSSCILTRVRDKRNMFPRYALYAWGMPLMVLGGCLLIDLGHIFPGISIGYGGTWSQGGNRSGAGNLSSEKMHLDTVTTTTTTTLRVDLGYEEGSEIVQDDVKMSNSSGNADMAVVADHSFSCWIQEPLAALFVFGAPILVIFLMNCVFFVRTIVSIRNTNRLARHSGAGRTNSSNSARQMSGQNDVILYVKMSSVMGFTWVFGLASSIISSLTQEPTDVICYILHVLGVLFPILNSSQGLFILFAFVFNRRVFALYKSLGRKIRKYLIEKLKGRRDTTRKKSIAIIAKS